MNTIGTLFKLSIFGESHGNSVGIVIDGVPAGIPITREELEADLSRRKSGAKGTTPRQEADIPRIMSGVFENHTTGAPILILFENTNTRSKDYSFLLETPRPGHADFVAHKKFGGYEDYRGGGHFSGRITLGIVAAGVIAKKIIAPIIVKSTLIEAGGTTDIEKAVEKAIAEQDSIGGIVETIATNMPIGLGEPFFGNIKAVLAHYIYSIPAIKGLEFGSGFAAARMKGTEHNDKFITVSGKTATNYAGGINGGISNGNDLVFKVAVKPTSSIHATQHTMNMKTGQMTDLSVEGRHDTCIALRIPVVVEAMTCLALADLVLQEQKFPRVVKS
ncbi:MAG TPA: chorismate synthase [Bacteroidales bacterium]|nr:chorismate synthase [Bacteroidales bacterium]